MSTGPDNQSCRYAATPANGGIHWDVSYSILVEPHELVRVSNEFLSCSQRFFVGELVSVIPAITPSCFNGAIKLWSVDFVEGQAEKK